MAGLDQVAVIRASCDSALLEQQQRAAAMEAMRAHALPYGYEVACDVPTDGDCYFHSIGHLLGRAPDQSAELRAELVAFLNSDIVALNSVVERIAFLNSVLVYEVKFSKKCGPLQSAVDAEFLNKLAIGYSSVEDSRVAQGMANMLGRNLMIITSSGTGGASSRLYHPFSMSAQNATVLALGHIEERHFVPLRRKVDPSMRGLDSSLELDSTVVGQRGTRRKESLPHQLNKTSTDDEDTSLNASDAGIKKAKKWYQQQFKVEWMLEPELAEWLRPDPVDRYRAICTVCDKRLKNPNKTALVNHQASVKHKAMRERRENGDDEGVEANPTKKHARKPNTKARVAKAELLLTSFMAENNAPFQKADQLLETLKKMFPDSSIAQSLSMEDGMERYESCYMTEVCKTQKFSIIVDESIQSKDDSAPSTSQTFVVIVRYFDFNKSELVDALMDRVVVDSSEDAASESLYAGVKDLFARRKISLRNVIGFATDSCSPMTGEDSGFQKLLRKDVPYVCILGCSNNSFVLCANQASEHLPSWLEAFARNVCHYFTHTNKRRNMFRAIQDVVESPKNRRLQLPDTQWLSCGPLLEKMLEHWDALCQFFETESQENDLDGAKEIYQTMTTLGTKHMLLFVKYIVAKVDKMNAEFQSQKFRLHKVYSTVLEEYRSLLALFVLDSALESQSIGNIDPVDQRWHKKLQEISVGGRCEALLMRESLGAEEVNFRMDALKYMVELCVQIRRRFPLAADSIIAQMSVLDVDEATSRGRRAVKSIVKLASCFPNITKENDLDALEDQWNGLPNARETLGEMIKMEPPQFWHELKSVKDGRDRPRFGLLADFMQTLALLPHSSAGVEHILAQDVVKKAAAKSKLVKGNGLTKMGVPLQMRAAPRAKAVMDGSRKRKRSSAAAAQQPSVSQAIATVLPSTAVVGPAGGAGGDWHHVEGDGVVWHQMEGVEWNQDAVGAGGGAIWTPEQIRAHGMLQRLEEAERLLAEMEAALVKARMESRVGELRAILRDLRDSLMPTVGIS